jgi:hypothetical protein
MRIVKAEEQDVILLDIPLSTILPEHFSSLIILDIKKRIQREIGLRLEDQVVLFNGRIIHDTEGSEECGITDDSVLELTVSSRVQSIYQIDSSGGTNIAVFL